MTRSRSREVHLRRDDAELIEHVLRVYAQGLENEPPGQRALAIATTLRKRGFECKCPSCTFVGTPVLMRDVLVETSEEGCQKVVLAAGVKIECRIVNPPTGCPHAK